MVKYINVNKEELPVSISYYALEKLKQESGKAIGDWNENDISYLEPLFFYALEAGFKAEKKVFDIKREDIIFMLDECWLDFSSLITEFFTEVAGNQKKVKK
jgi:hypothetical protein